MFCVFVEDHEQARAGNDMQAEQAATVADELEFEADVQMIADNNAKCKLNIFAIIFSIYAIVVQLSTI